MDTKYSRISRIENFFSMLLTAGDVSSNIFVGEKLPAVISESWNDMALIDANTQTDWNSHTSGSVSILLYARPVGAHGQKNVKVLDKMEAALDSAIASSNDTHYVITENWRDHGYDTSRDFHYNVINVKVVVK